MKTIYLAHPLSAPTPEGIAENRLNAARWGVWIAQHYPVAVSADWIWWSMALDETAENRALGLSRAYVMITRADELWLAGGRISEGMWLEKEHAERCGLRVVDLTRFGALPGYAAITSYNPVEYYSPEGLARFGMRGRIR